MAPELGVGAQYLLLHSRDTRGGGETHWHSEPRIRSTSLKRGTDTELVNKSCGRVLGYVVSLSCAVAEWHGNIL